jgi:hypothetical protein
LIVMQPFDLWGQRGWAGRDVAGESHYLGHIRSLLPRSVGEDGAELEVIAQLVPEPRNAHDPTAVAVKCGGGVVGYLPREDARIYFPILAALVAQGWMPQVAARVWGGYRSDYESDNSGRIADRPQFVGSVRLDLAEPHLIVPANMPPNGRHVLLPHGNGIQVTGEEAHLSTLTPWLRAEGEGWIYVTLHELVEQTARSSRTIVEIRVDGSAAGTLTPKMSGEYLPAVRVLAEHGIIAAARAILKGNRIKADIVLHAARANQLSAVWLEGLASSAPPRSGGDERSATKGADFDSAAGSAIAPALPQAVEEPAVWRFNPAPGWPPPPSGWIPPAGWRPDPSWQPAPPGWVYWLPHTLPAGAFGFDPPPWS